MRMTASSTAPATMTAVHPSSHRAAPYPVADLLEVPVPVVGEPAVVRPVSGPLTRRFGELSLCLDCSDAFRAWLRAGELAEALRPSLVGPIPELSPWLQETEPFHS